MKVTERKQRPAESQIWAGESGSKERSTRGVVPFSSQSRAPGRRARRRQLQINNDCETPYCSAGEGARERHRLLDFTNAECGSKLKTCDCFQLSGLQPVYFGAVRVRQKREGPRAQTPRSPADFHVKGLFLFFQGGLAQTGLQS